MLLWLKDVLKICIWYLFIIVLSLHLDLPIVLCRGVVVCLMNCRWAYMIGWRHVSFLLAGSEDKSRLQPVLGDVRQQIVGYTQIFF